MRYFLELSYKGKAYHGWQSQKNAVSVQQRLEEAMGKILGDGIDITGAGRTDTGVHAKQMFCHFDTSKRIPSEENFIYKLNAVLPRDIAVSMLKKVKPNAHARFSASSRTYVYRLSTERNPFLMDEAWYYPFSLDLELMNKACSILKTHRDFSSFAKTGSPSKTNVCKIMSASWNVKGREIQFKIRADRFLRNMVRAIVGTMLEIGRGDMDLKNFEKVILSRKRSSAGLSVPAHGLCLTEVRYPSEIFLS